MGPGATSPSHTFDVMIAKAQGRVLRPSQRFTDREEAAEHEGLGSPTANGGEPRVPTRPLSTLEEGSVHVSKATATRESDTARRESEPPAARGRSRSIAFRDGEETEKARQLAKEVATGVKRISEHIGLGVPTAAADDASLANYPEVQRLKRVRQNAVESQRELATGVRQPAAPALRP